MSIKSHKTILNIFFCALALIALSACTAGGGGGAKQPNFVNCASNSSCDPGTADLTTGYLPSTSETPPTEDGWAPALTAERTPEYQASGGADRIGAAYAYARGYTGTGEIVSVVGQLIERDHKDLANQRVTGYGEIYGDDSDNSAYLGTCTGVTASLSGGGCGTASTNPSTRAERKQSTHLAGIIAGESGNGDTSIQGIAYNAKIKPINIYDGFGLITGTDRVNAIAAASGMVDEAVCTASSVKTIEACKTIAVMHNIWIYQFRSNVQIVETADNGDETTFQYIDNSSDISTILSASAGQEGAWIEAVKTTVLVFPQGDYGFNSENGMVKFYDTSRARAMENGNPKDVAWSIVNAASDNPITGDINLGVSYTNLPDAVPDVQGKTLSVIALKANNRIWEYSNGCGNAKDWCLGAPGVDINSVIPGTDTYEVASGTGLAAAYVSGAIAVLKGAFPSLTPEQLVSIILNTADYIKENDADTKTDGTNRVYGHGALNLARATDPIGSMMTTLPDATALGAGITIDNSGITLPTSFGESLGGFTAGFTDDYNRAFIGNPARITRENAAFTLGDTIATWESPTLQSIALDSNSKMQFTDYTDNADAKDTLIFTHNLPNHTIAFSYNEESKSPDLRLAGAGDDLHFQKIRPIANDLMQVNSTHKLGKVWNVKNAITSGEFDTGKRFNEAMANLNYASENHQLTIGAGTLKEYGQFLGASGTGAYQLSDATQSRVTHLAVTQNLPLNSAIKLKYTNFKTEVDMRYNNFANINDLTANEYQLSFGKKQLFGKNDSLNIELIQPLAVTDGNLQQSTVLGYNDAGEYNNVTQNYTLKPTNRRQQLRMTWQNQINPKTKTRFFISMQYENHVNNLRDNNDSQILGGISTRF